MRGGREGGEEWLEWSCGFRLQKVKSVRPSVPSDPICPPGGRSERGRSECGCPNFAPMPMYRFTEAVQAAVQHSFRLEAMHIYTFFPAASAASGGGLAEPPASPPMSGATSPNRWGASYLAAAPVSSSAASSATYRRSDSRVFGSVPSGGSSGNVRGGPGAAGNGAARSPSKAPRQLARLLKPVQGAGDASFENINRVTKVR